MTFEEASRHAHEVLCDRVKVPYDWFEWKFTISQERFHNILDKFGENLKVLEVQWDDQWHTVKGKALAHPKLELMLA